MKITLRDRSRKRDDVGGRTVTGCAQRMFGRRVRVLISQDDTTALVAETSGRVIGEVAIHKG